MSACVISHLRLQRFFFLEPCAACVTLGWSPFRGRVFSQGFFSAHGATARILEVGRKGGEKKHFQSGNFFATKEVDAEQACKNTTLK